MKNIYILFAAFLIHPFDSVSQLPLPCLNYNNDNFNALQSIAGSKSIKCLEINMSESAVDLNDNYVRDFTVENAIIEPGFSYVPEAGGNRFSISLGENSEMEGAWFEPINYFPQLYEKIEWGVKLPAQVELAIDNWIHNDQFPLETPLSPVLNPFDPEQIDLHAVIDYTEPSGNYSSQPINAFFYREYDRITVYNNPNSEDMQDPDFWRWDEKPSVYRFRFRWSSTVVAHHTVRIHLSVPSIGEWEMEPFEFDSYWGDPRNSFVSVTENGHYFKTDDGHVFMPIGLNINEGTFGCSCMEGVSDTANCGTCYEWGLDDPCCGISPNKRKRHSMEGTTLHEYTLATAAYEKLDRILEHLSEVAGGNAFRTLFDPLSFDIEFEKMNNYYDRQYQAWEFDHVLNKCHDLNLRMQWDMQIHYTITHHSHGDDRFDWDNQYNCTPCGTDEEFTGTNGWCYWNSCPDMGGPVDFLTNVCAVANYKKKLRYMIARWGYSRNIFLMELMSEMNNIGSGDLTVIDDVNENGVAETWVHVDTLGNELPPEIATQIQLPKPYDTDAINTRPKVAWWHNEMARYIKEDLHHTRHLIAADYAGTAPMGAYPDASIACQSEYFDDSWHSSYIDVVSFSNYSDGWNRWEKMADQEYRKESGQTDGLLCGWDNPEINEDDAGMFSPLNSYESIWKPIIHAEEGYTPCMREDYTGFVKDLLAGAFSGHASAGMSWDESTSVEHWNMIGEVLEYLDLHVLNDVDIGTGSWMPDHAYSKERVEENNCKFAEAIYLRNQNIDYPKYTGVILNRTWNHHTVCGCNANLFPENGEFESLAVPTNVGWQGNQIFLEGAGTHHFTIRYFDPYTKEQVNQVNRWSSSNKLGLEDYPLMALGEDESQPFYFFEAFLEGSEFDEYPMQNEGNSTLINNIEKAGITDSQSLSNNIDLTDNSYELLVFPNPGGNHTTIKSSQELLNCEAIIFSCDGKELRRFKILRTQQSLNFSEYEDGIYFIVCPELAKKIPYIKLLNN